MSTPTVFLYPDFEMEDEVEEYLVDEMERLEDFAYDNPDEDDTNLHVVRLLWARKNGLRFPLFGIRASRRLTNKEFRCYAHGVCSISFGPHVVCGMPVQDKSAGFKLRHVECNEHATDSLEIYGEIQWDKE